MTAVDLVVFDCDGVLLDSNLLKVRLFGEVAEWAGADAAGAEAFRSHVRANFGSSRYRMFEHLIAEQGIAGDVATLSGRYAETLYDGYVACDETPGMAATLAKLHDRGVPMAVVSGSDEDELRRVLAERGLASWFVGIHGSPTGKAEHVRAILAERAVDPARVLFVGDAEADWKAASATGVRFVYMSACSTADDRMRALQAEHGFSIIHDLRDLPALLEVESPR